MHLQAKCPQVVEEVGRPRHHARDSKKSVQSSAKSEAKSSKDVTPCLRINLSPVVSPSALLGGHPVLAHGLGMKPRLH